MNSCRGVEQRAAKMFEWRLPRASILDIALDHLTLGRAALYAAILEGRAALPRRQAEQQLGPTDDEFSTARRDLEAAVDGLRRAGTQHRFPPALLTRAWLRFLTGARTGPESAQADLDEAREIAERGPMPLFMADIHLYRARLFGSQNSGVRSQQYPWESPQADLAAARQLIESCGYWRRKEELENAEKVILG
jgi:hypothetical protein